MAQVAGGQGVSQGTTGLYVLIGHVVNEFGGSRTAVRASQILERELGVTRNNLQRAVAHLKAGPLPAGADIVLDRICERARELRLDQLLTDPLPQPPAKAGKPTSFEVGIATVLTFCVLGLLAGSALLIIFAR